MEDLIELNVLENYVWSTFRQVFEGGNRVQCDTYEIYRS